MVQDSQQQSQCIVVHRDEWLDSKQVTRRAFLLVYGILYHISPSVTGSHDVPMAFGWFCTLSAALVYSISVTLSSACLIRSNSQEVKSLYCLKAAWIASRYVRSTWGPSLAVLTWQFMSLQKATIGSRIIDVYLHILVTRLLRFGETEMESKYM